VSLHLTSQTNSLMTVTSVSVCPSMKQHTPHLLTVSYHMAIHSATTTSIASNVHSLIPRTVVLLYPAFLQANGIRTPQRKPDLFYQVTRKLLNRDHATQRAVSYPSCRVPITAQLHQGSPLHSNVTITGAAQCRSLHSHLLPRHP
jgi:hypothetical protein